MAVTDPRRQRPHGGPHRRARGGGSRTVIVAWLRVLLPLAALAILSTLFLLSRKPDPEAAIPYATVDAAARARDPRITAPAYAGVTADGATLSLKADSATPTAEGGVGAAEGLMLDWKSANGLEVDLTAPSATMDDGLITLSGGVRMTTSTDWTLSAPQIEAATDRSRITGSGGIAATAPFGAITADSVTLRQQAETNAAADGSAGAPANLLDFAGSVRLIYRP